MPLRLKATDVPRLRLVAQRLVRHELSAPEQVVQWMTAMQGQDLPGAKWSVGVRVPGSCEGDIHAAFNAGRIVRSWPIRGTLHLVSPADLHWMLALTTPRVLAGAKKRQQQLGLDARAFQKAERLAVAALEGGRALTREELFARFEAKQLKTEGGRGYHLLWFLSQSGILCLGPLREKEQQVVLAHEWIARPRSLQRDEALGELVRRYFASHGPATLQDFMAWTRLTATDARRGLGVALAHLTELQVDGSSHWMETESLERAQADATLARSSFLVLSGFDEYVLGYRERGLFVPEAHADKIAPGANGMFRPTLVAGGHVVGTWSKKSSAKKVQLTFEPFEAIPANVERGLRKAATEYGRFLGTQVS